MDGSPEQVIAILLIGKINKKDFAVGLYANDFDKKLELKLCGNFW